MLNPIEPKLPNPPPRNLDHSMSCKYCSGAPGHDIEKCWQLKTAIQELIDTSRIEVQAPEAPNINQNPLPAYHKTNMIEIVHKVGKPKKPSQTIMMIRASEVRPGEKSTSEKLVIRLSGANSEPSVVVKKGFLSRVAVKQEKAKVVVPGMANKPVIIMEGARIDTLRKTPAQISLLSLLIQSDEHRWALMKILNEAHIPNKILVNHLEKIANKIFEVNRVTFSDDELPMEGTDHNRVLYLTVKCEDSVVTRVLIDNGSNGNIFPLSTLNNLKVRMREFTRIVSAFEDLMVEAKIQSEIVEHREDNRCAHSDAIVPFIEVEDDKGPRVYQVFDTVPFEKFLRENVFQFQRPSTRKRPVTMVPSSVVDVDGDLIEMFERIFADVNMLEVGEGSSKVDVQFYVPSVWMYKPCYLCAKHEIGSFVDCYAGYYQILMDEEDVQKTSFITPWGTYCYRVMPFGLKNAGATYMRAIMTIFHSMIHREIEVYVDDVIIKSKKQSDHVGDLRKFLQRLRRWIDECQEAFDKIKGYLSNPPVLVPPEPGRPLILYLTVLDNSFGCVLGQHDITGRKEQAIYYLSKKFTSYEVKYTHFERICCTLTWVAQKLKHYLSSYTTYLISRLDLLKYIYQKPMPTGRLAKWKILLTEFDIVYVTRTVMKAQALADHLAENLVDEGYEPLKTYFTDDEVMHIGEVEQVEKPGWKLFFDGADNMKGIGIGAVLISETRHHYPVTAQLRFYCTNNMAEYEACILGLSLAVDMGVQEVLVLGDSDLLVHQIQGEWETLDLKLTSHRQCLHDLCQRFRPVEFRHIPRIHNEVVDALATFASMLHHPDKAYVDP
ncbi:uncharacterized protein [Nicotiana sylvestris]|uniref:uncharacterized protein n=1 Tax=Nicotiana sylvestris TaxID=4096 RepID=UPI00388CCE5A